MVAQNSAIFSIINKYIVQAAKRIGADLFEITAPEIGKIVDGRKTQNICKDVGTKTVRKQFRGGKMSSKRRTKRTISLKGSSRTSQPTILPSHQMK